LHDVGFTTSQKLQTPQHTARGFQRPIIVYTKGSDGNKRGSPSDKNMTNSQSVMSSKSSKMDEPSNDLLKVDASYKVHEMPDNSEMEVSVSCEDSGSQNCNDLTKSSSSNKVLQLEGQSTLNSRNLPEYSHSAASSQKALVSEKKSCDNIKSCSPFGDVSSSCRSISSSGRSSSNNIPLKDNISENKNKTCLADTITSSDGQPVAVISEKSIEVSKLSNEPTRLSASLKKDSELPKPSSESRTLESGGNLSQSENGEICDMNSSSTIRKSDHESDDDRLSPSKKVHKSNDP